MPSWLPSDDTDPALGWSTRQVCPSKGDSRLRAGYNDKDAMSRGPHMLLLWLTAAVLLALAGPAAFAVSGLTLPSAT